MIQLRAVVVVSLMVFTFSSGVVANDATEPDCQPCQLWEQFWESPSGGAEILDSNTDTTTQPTIPVGSRFVNNGSGVGQVFVPQTSFVYRLDLKMQNRFDLRPFSVSIWQWDDNNNSGTPNNYERARTINQTPLWREIRVLPGPNRLDVISLYPRLPVTPDTMYYVEVNCPNPTDCGWGIVGGDIDNGSWGLELFTQDANKPPDTVRQKVWAGLLRDDEDLWFRTYDAPGGGAPQDPCRCGSVADPGVWTAPGQQGAPISAADFRFVVEQRALRLGAGCEVVRDGSGNVIVLAFQPLRSHSAFGRVVAKVERRSSYP